MSFANSDRPQTLFGMNFFGFEDTNEGHSLVVASNIWIYVAAALTCSITTVGLGYFWWSRRQPSFNEEVDLEQSTKDGN